MITGVKFARVVELCSSALGKFWGDMAPGRQGPGSVYCPSVPQGGYRRCLSGRGRHTRAKAVNSHAPSTFNAHQRAALHVRHKGLETNIASVLATILGKMSTRGPIPSPIHLVQA